MIPQKSEIGTLKAVENAFNLQAEYFYLNDVQRVVWNQTKPFKPLTTTISAKMRKLRHQHKINYSCDINGVYCKIYRDDK